MPNNFVLPSNQSDINGFIHKINNIYVTCDASGEETELYCCENAIDTGVDNHFHSGIHENSWLQVSFPKK